MALVSRTYSATSANPVATGSTILAAHINTDLDTIYADYNGNITNANLSASAAIAASKTVFGTFTAWGSYTPTIKKADGTTALAATIAAARYTQIAKKVAGYVVLTSVGDPAGSYVYFTLPVAPAAVTTDTPVGSGYISGTGLTNKICVGLQGNGRTDLRVVNTTETTMPVAGDLQIRLNFEYEAA